MGKDDSGTRMEIVELANHPFFVAAQVRALSAARPRRGGVLRGRLLRGAGNLLPALARPLAAACVPLVPPTLLPLSSRLLHPPLHPPQFHPEFKSRPMKPSPLFLGLLLASARKLDHFLSGRATPVTSPAKPGLRPVNENVIAALTAAKLQL